MPTTLIQLISEQTVPNLLPVMRLDPDRLVHLVTPRTQVSADNIERAIHALGMAPEIRLVGLSDMPDIAETYGWVRQCGQEAAEQGHQVVVNFTGGTKLMGIGAFGASTELRAPALYVDSRKMRFVPGDQKGWLHAFLEGELGFEKLAQRLRVDVLAIANGMQRVTHGSDWSRALTLARTLHENPAIEGAVLAAIHGPDGLCPHGREPRQAIDWLKLLERPIDLPDEVVPAAEEAGTVRRAEAGLVLHSDEAERSGLRELADRGKGHGAPYFRWIGPLQQRLALLTGGWWEVIVAEEMKRSGRFRDLRWSVQVGNPRGADQEEDLLAVEDVRLVFVSCKRSSARQRLTPLMEEIHSRAATIGGNFNRRILAVRHDPGGRTRLNMEENARRLGIELVFGEDINGYF